jgi:DNA-binding XRE family transcriptional regulator
MNGELIAKLIEIQARAVLTDKEMAKQLGCSRQLWQMTRTRKIPPSNTIIKCISKNFPELHSDLIKFLAQDGDELSNSGAQNPTRQPSRTQGRGVKEFCVVLMAKIIDKVETFIERH